MITLYGSGSPNVLKVVLALEELALPYRFEPVDVFKGEQFTDAFGALTPNRKVPVIVDAHSPDGQPVTLWESGAILLYLAEKTGQLMPTVPRERWTVQQWLMFQMAGIGPMFGQQSHFRVYAQGEEHAYARARYATEVKRLYDVVEVRLRESAYLGGAAYSIADIAAWPWLQRTSLRGVDTATLPATCRWIETVRERPGVQRALQAFAAHTANGTDPLQAMQDQPDLIDRFVGRGRYSRA